MDKVMDRTTSMPKYVLLYELEKIRSLDLETSLVILRKECEENIRPTHRKELSFSTELF